MREIGRALAACVTIIELYYSAELTGSDEHQRLLAAAKQAGTELIEVAPDRLSGIIKADYDRWIAIIREAGIRLE